MQDGADHEPSGSRAITSPEPAFPEKTKPALMTWNTAKPEKHGKNIREDRRVVSSEFDQTLRHEGDKNLWHVVKPL